MQRGHAFYESIFFLLNSVLANRNFPVRSKIFANSLNPDQDRQNVGPDLNPIPLTLLIVFLKAFFEKVDFEKCK